VVIHTATFDVETNLDYLKKSAIRSLKRQFV